MTKFDTDIRQAAADPERCAIDRRLADLIARKPRAAPRPLEAAMEYALLAPGKRLRPRLLLAIAARSDPALDAACAVEMVHTASLILDDLPSMDDARLRRGRATTHIRFGEATAVLAAVALITEAFEVLARLDLAPGPRGRLVAILSRSIGRSGMSAGQAMDLAGAAPDATPDATAIDTTNALKTASLFAAAAEMGAVLRGLCADRTADVLHFARHFGQAFQLADDALDRAGSPDLTGKDVGADAGKATMDRVAGLAAARNLRAGHLAAARAALIRAGLDPAAFAPFVAAVGGRGRP